MPWHIIPWIMGNASAWFVEKHLHIMFSLWVYNNLEIIHSTLLSINWWAEFVPENSIFVSCTKSILLVSRVWTCLAVLLFFLKQSMNLAWCREKGMIMVLLFCWLLCILFVVWLTFVWHTCPRWLVMVQWIIKLIMVKAMYKVGAVAFPHLYHDC